MKWLKIISVTVFISSAFCGSLNRRTKKQVPTEQVNPDENNEPSLSDDELQQIFGPSEESSTPSTNITSTNKDSESLDESYLRQLFSDTLINETKESPVDGVLETSIQDLQSTTKDSEPLDPDLLSNIFSDTLIDETNDPPVDGVLETSTQDLQSTTKDSMPLEPDLVSKIFSGTLKDETKESLVDGELKKNTQSLQSTTKDSEPLDPDLISKIFSDTLIDTTKESPVDGGLETNALDLQSTTKDSEPLNKYYLRQLFSDTLTDETLESPVDGVLETSSEDLQSTTKDSKPLDPDLLSEIFSDTLIDETKESPIDGELETSTQNPQSTTKNSEPLDEDFLLQLFSGKLINETTGSPDEKVPKTSTQDEKLDVDTDTRIFYEPTDDFNFVDIDWDNVDDIENTTTDSHSGPRAFDGNSDDAKQPTSNENLILTYPIDEIEPPLEDVTPKVPIRIDVNKTSVESTTASGEYISSSEEITDPIDPSTDDEVIPKQCKYGTEEFPIPKPNVKKEGRRIADIKCEEQMLHVKYNVYDVSKNKLICDRLREITTLLGGKMAKNKQFPHMGGVGWLNRENKYIFFCGSTLISPRFTLTAAHCRSVSLRGDIGVDDPYPKIVRFGNVDIEKTIETSDVAIEKFLTLKEYDANPLMRYNDIGLIRLAMEVTLSEHVRPACLWHKSMAELKTGNVTGWGQTVSAQTESRSRHLRYAEVDILGKEICNKYLSHRNFRHWDGLSDTQFCAGKIEGGVDTCQGDSGGPLQVRDSFSEEKNITIHYIVGITSFGFDCGKPQLPGLYTSVNKYLCWIEKTVWPSENNTMCNEDTL